MVKKNFQCQVHTWMMKKVKKPQYIRRRKKKGRGTENYSKTIALGLVRGYSLHKLRLQLQSLYAKIQYLGPRFRLAFSPTLYKFIVWATWAWIHSCSGFKLNLVLTSKNLKHFFFFLIKLNILRVVLLTQYFHNKT